MSLSVVLSHSHSVCVLYVKFRQELSRSSFLNHDFFFLKKEDFLGPRKRLLSLSEHHKPGNVELEWWSVVC